MTKNSRKVSQWRAREIESDSAACIAARKVEREDWAEAERDELLALERWSRITDEDLVRARVIGHGLPVKDDAGDGRWRDECHARLPAASKHRGEVRLR